MNSRPNLHLSSANRSTLRSQSTATPALVSRTGAVSRWLWIAYIISAGGLTLALVLWDAHQGRQVIHVEELGLARDVQWLGTSGKFWLLRTPAGALLTLESPHKGWAMEANTRLVRKITANGKRWVCDASLVHCIPTADEQHTLTGDQVR